MVGRYKLACKTLQIFVGNFWSAGESACVSVRARLACKRTARACSLARVVLACLNSFRGSNKQLACWRRDGIFKLFPALAQPHTNVLEMPTEVFSKLLRAHFCHFSTRKDKL